MQNPLTPAQLASSDIDLTSGWQGLSLAIVEDDDDLRQALAQGLGELGCLVEVAIDGEAGWTLLADGRHDLAIIDLGLPGLDGLGLIERLRRSGSDLPLLILSARDQVSDRIGGLEAGADDYLVKPFAVDELLARLRALHRRRAPSELLRLGAALSYRPSSRELAGPNGLRPLTSREGELLLRLYRSGAEPIFVSSDELAHKLYGDTGPTARNAIEVLVARLRRKLDAVGVTDLLEHRRGLGYRLQTSMI